MRQMYNIVGKLCSMYDFSETMPDGTFIPNDDNRYTVLRHIESGLIIAYTTEKRLGL